MGLEITRLAPLLDYDIDRSGDGRTVIAYAAAFNVLAPISDQHGEYDEKINPAAFNKLLARAGSINNVSVHFNHGLTLWGTPSDRYAMPLGTAEEIKPDGRGLLTRTRYAKTELGDEALQLWRDGAIRGQSFRGQIYPTTDRKTRGADGRTVIERMQLGLKEYGPTPSPAYADAGLVAIRSQLLERPASEMTPAERRELAALLAEAPDLSITDPQVDPDVDPGTLPPAASPAPGLSPEVLLAANANRRRR